MKLSQQLGFFQTHDAQKLLAYVAERAAIGDVPAILSAMDTFAITEQYLMHIGQEARTALTQILLDHEPIQILELGAYCGYSTMCMADILPDAHITTVEHSRNSPALCKALFDYANVSNQITFIRGRADQVIPTLQTSYDLIFIDHNKSLYLQDIQLLEEYNAIKNGAIIIADNASLVSAAPYVNYIKQHPQFTSKTITFPRHGDKTQTDSLEVSIYTDTI